MNLEPAKASGGRFMNYLLHGHTDSDDDNTYLPSEEPNYSEYKSGAQAAMAFVARSKSPDRADQRG
jgi:hypothetical protein